VKAAGQSQRALSSCNGGKKPPPTRLQPIRKKCVNGFIMFCRLNRRAYLRANPGTASTAATRDLAELWRRMSEPERQPYCMKALQFSLIHNRLVKPSHVTIPSNDESLPKPLAVLLLEKSFPPTNQNLPESSFPPTNQNLPEPPTSSSVLCRGEGVVQ
ncbi:meiosis initiator protein, partial [Mantella aurantiaca]